MSIRTGDAYRDSLHDGRDVWLSGQQVADVANHPALRGCVDTIASLYDQQHAPAARDILTLEGPGGQDRYSMGYLLPRTENDLKQRRRMIEFVSAQQGGLMARLPDYVPLILLGLYDQRRQLARQNAMWADNIERYLDSCRTADPCLAHSFADPQIDRSKPSNELNYLQIASQDAKGIVVRGVKTVATLAPIANEYLVLTPPRAGISPNQVVFFAIPIDSRGLRFVCRQPFSQSGEWERPLGSRFDEMDAWAVFDDVHIPHNRVFLARDIDALRHAWPHINAWAYHHMLIRMAVKAELFVGVCSLIAEYLGTKQFQNVREQIADVVRYLESLRAFVRAAEADAEITGSGLMMPNLKHLMVGHMYAVEHHPQLLHAVRNLSGQSILMTPSLAELRNSSIRSFVERYLMDNRESTEDRTRLFRLAWDLAGSSFASRQLLFETFNARDLTKSRMEFFRSYDSSGCVEIARRVAGITTTVQNIQETATD